MEPMDRLRQALEVAAEFPGPSMVADLAGAARLVLEGERILWCVTHNAEGVENHGGASDECWRSVWADTHEPEGLGFPYDLCRMVERLLTEVPEDKEK